MAALDERIMGILRNLEYETSERRGLVEATHEAPWGYIRKVSTPAGMSYTKETSGKVHVLARTPSEQRFDSIPFQGNMGHMDAEHLQEAYWLVIKDIRKIGDLEFTSHKVGDIYVAVSMLHRGPGQVMFGRFEPGLYGPHPHRGDEQLTILQGSGEFIYGDQEMPYGIAHPDRNQVYPTRFRIQEGVSHGLRVDTPTVVFSVVTKDDVITPDTKA